MDIKGMFTAMKAGEDWVKEWREKHPELKTTNFPPSYRIPPEILNTLSNKELKRMLLIKRIHQTIK